MTLPDPVTHCLIWGEGYQATGRTNFDNNTAVVESCRTGGAYKISWEAWLSLRYKDDSWKARLTTWLINQREQGVEVPMIDGKAIALIDQQRPLPIHERAERLLRLLAKWGEGAVGKSIIISKGIRPIEYHALAWTESTGWADVAYFLDYLMSMGWTKGVEFDNEGDDSELPPMYREAPEPYPYAFKGIVTIKGFAHIAERETNPDSSQAFVAMWFDDSMDKAYEAAIEPAIREAGYKALRIDQVEHAGRIDDRIIAEIKRSRFVIADFTHGPDGNRGSVYYEAGFAHGFDIPVIFTCKEEEIPKKQSKLAFDTQQYNHIMWKTTDELRERLKDRIEAVIGEGPEKGG